MKKAKKKLQKKSHHALKPAAPKPPFVPEPDFDDVPDGWMDEDEKIDYDDGDNPEEN